MKLLTPEERQRLEARYDMLDLGYLILRQAAYFQRRAILNGDYPAVLNINLTPMTTSNNVSRCWAEIQALLMPPAEASAEGDPEAEPVPAKEFVQ